MSGDARFDIVVRAALGADPDSDLSTATWTSLSTQSSRVQPYVSLRVGRHSMAGQSDPLEIALRLGNTDGWLTPYNQLSPYYPYIRRNLPIQVLAAAHGDTPVELATGFLSDARVRWTEGICMLDVTARGRLYRLQRGGSVPLTSVTSTVTTSNPVAFWPLTDGEGATSAASGLTGGPSMTKTGSLHFGTGNGGAGQPKILDLAYFTGSPGGLNGPVSAGTSETSWRVECKMTWPTGGAAQGVIGWTTQGTIQFWQLGYSESTKALRLQYWPADGSSSTTVDSATAPNPGDRMPHTYRITADQSGANIAVVVYVDGVAQITTTATTHTNGHPTKAYINPANNNGSQMPAIGGYTFWAPYAASVDTESATTGYGGERAVVRMQRLCDEQGVPFQVPTGLTLVDAYTTAMGVQPEGKLLNLLRECEAADAGLLYDAGPSGALTYIPRYALYNAATVLDLTAVNLSDSFSPVLDDTDLATEVTVSVPDGTSGTYSSDVETEGHYTQSFSLNLDDSEDPVQHASWRSNLTLVSAMRYEQVPLNFVRDPHLLDAWLASAGVGIRIRLSDLPAEHSPLPVEQLVQGYTAVVDSMSWDVVCDCVPYEPYEVIVLDTSYSTLVSSVSSSDTTFTSVVSRLPRWTTTDEPVALQCGGETPIIATTIADVAITFVNASATVNADNASVTPNLPASVTTGDLLLVLAAIRSSGTGTVNAPTGYTRLVGWANFAVFGKIHSGSESNPTVTFTGGSAGDTTSAATLAFRNTVSDVTRCVIDWVDWLNPSAQDIAFPPLPAPKYDGCALVVAGWKQDDWTSVATVAGWTETIDSPSLTGNDQGMVLDYQIQTTSTAITSGSFTVTGGATAISRGLILAIAPGRSTLTVTRPTNGTAISHAAGDTLQVADTANLGL